jgi:chromosome segregation ATPase
MDDVMTDPGEDRRAERARTQAEIARLETRRHQLDLARGEFDHEARRAGDALVRAGGRSLELEKRIKALRANQALTEADLEKADKALAALQRRLAEIERLSGA